MTKLLHTLTKADVLTLYKSEKRRLEDDGDPNVLKNAYLGTLSRTHLELQIQCPAPLSAVHAELAEATQKLAQLQAKKPAANPAAMQAAAIELDAAKVSAASEERALATIQHKNATIGQLSGHARHRGSFSNTKAADRLASTGSADILPPAADPHLHGHQADHGTRLWEEAQALLAAAHVTEGGVQ